MDVFIRARDGRRLDGLAPNPPAEAGRVKGDYAALAYRDRRVAVVSQASARLWWPGSTRKRVPWCRIRRRSEQELRQCRGNRLVVPGHLGRVSDRKKRRQPARCEEKDQSIHVFRS